MREWWRRVRPEVFASIIYFLVRLIGLTLRIQINGAENLEGPGGKIMAGWHGRSFLAAYYFRNRGWYALISQSRDGEIMARVFQKLGYKIVRGSTGKGGIKAAVELARILKKGGTAILTPDGSKGPFKIVQDGPMWLAQQGEAQFIPGSTIARPRKLMNSWDRYLVPMPFARAKIEVFPPIAVPKNLDPEQFEQKRAEITDALNRSELLLEKEFGYA